MSQVSKDEELIEVRFSFPKDVHNKVKSHKRRLSAKKDDDVTMEEAILDLIRSFKPLRS